MATPSSVDDHLAQVPEAERAALERLRVTIRAAAPDTAETISYQMPTFTYRGRALVGVGAEIDAHLAAKGRAGSRG